MNEYKILDLVLIERRDPFLYIDSNYKDIESI